MVPEPFAGEGFGDRAVKELFAGEGIGELADANAEVLGFCWCPFANGIDGFRLAGPGALPQAAGWMPMIALQSTVSQCPNAEDLAWKRSRHLVSSKQNRPQNPSLAPGRCAIQLVTDTSNFYPE